MMPLPAGASIQKIARLPFETPSRIMLSHTHARKLKVAIPQRDQAQPMRLPTFALPEAASGLTVIGQFFATRGHAIARHI